MEIQADRPGRRIASQADVSAFRSSQSYGQLVEFLRSLCAAVEGRPHSPRVDESDGLRPPGVEALYNLLEEVNKIADRCPPVDQPSRFGNRGFQNFYDELKTVSDDLLTPLIPYLSRGAPFGAEFLRTDLKAYLQESFGNRARIDYGTGHELNFVLLLLCVAKLGGFDTVGEYQSPEAETLCSVVFVVFRKYIALMRRLQRQYVMEPAGSRGVWGLDDFHFLPFYLGASQLVHQTEVSPSQACDPEIVTRNADRYMYLDAIREILEVKKHVPLAECAPLLNDISAVPNWKKVCVGLLKMYEAEVLGRLPVVQHIHFGAVFPFD